MPYSWIPGHQNKKNEVYLKLMLPVNNILLSDLTPLTSGRNHPQQMTFEDQITILVYFHFEEHNSVRHLLQVLKENHFTRQYNSSRKRHFKEQLLRGHQLTWTGADAGIL